MQKIQDEIIVMGRSMGKQTSYKKNLSDIAKGVTGWTIVTSCMSGPLLLFVPRQEFLENALLVFMATGVLVPLTYSVSSGKNIAKEYIKIYDCLRNKLCKACAQDNKIHTK